MLKKTVIFTVLLLISIQFISVEKTNPKVDETLALKAPKEVMDLLKQSCYDCHSYETRWPAYSSIAPVSFFVASHVKKARTAMNFSKWKTIEPKIKKERLKRAIKTVSNEMMALPSYVSAHEEAKLSKDEKFILIKWFESELASLKDTQD
ncbi:heme-binding domain-containing protein [Sulfurimonas sp.]